MYLLLTTQSGASSGVRVFASPESSLEQALLACGINSEGYTITNRLNELMRQRSRHVANSKFYTRGTNEINFILRCFIGKHNVAFTYLYGDHLQKANAPGSAWCGFV